MFAYSHSDLYCEDVPLADLAARVGTPAYVYSAKDILENYAHMTTPSAVFLTPSAMR